MGAKKCDEPLGNPGLYCKVAIDEIKRVLFTSKFKDDGTLNFITKADAAAIANLQILFDKPNFSASVLEKIVPTLLIFDFKNEQADAEFYDEGGIFEPLADGNYDCSFILNKVIPYYIKQLKKLEDNTVVIYLVDKDDRFWGKESGVNIYPIDIEGLQVPNFNLKSRSAPSTEMVKFRIQNPEDMNDLISVTIADGDVTSDIDFYSLINGDITISSPAVTGCIAVLDTEEGDEAITGVPYTGFTFVDQADDSEITLAATGSVTESPDGTYTIDETALLTAGHVYSLQVTLDGFDIDVGTVTVAT